CRPFLHVPCIHLHLPPFPTRRSSDLIVTHINSGTVSIMRVSRLYWCRTRRCWACRRRITLSLSAVIQLTLNQIQRIVQNHNRIRSEEHTSELQSRFDLVCCLLLEK